MGDCEEAKRLVSEVYAILSNGKKIGLDDSLLFQRLCETLDRLCLHSLTIGSWK